MNTYQVFKSKPSDFQSTIIASGCYCVWNEKILFLKRHSSKFEGMTWGIPGGKSEKEEKPNQTVIREVFEEVGIDIKLEEIREIGKLYIRLPSVEYEFYLFSKAFDEEPSIVLALEEHTDYKWLTKQEALTYPLIRGGVEALHVYMESEEKV